MKIKKMFLTKQEIAFIFIEEAQKTTVAVINNLSDGFIPTVPGFLAVTDPR